jgi:MMP 1-O-methyltransferase
MTKDELGLILSDVQGWLAIDEAYWLYSAAAKLREGSTIVEIGSYHGRSTIALALGAKQSGSVVYAIDPHHVHEAGGYQFGPTDNVAFMQNVLKAGVGEWVRIINLPSHFGVDGWIPDIAIGLLFIDGAHEYECVKEDFEWYRAWLQDIGLVAIHDSTGAWEGPTRVVQEALSDGWRLVETVVNTSILERAK